MDAAVKTGTGLWRVSRTATFAALAAGMALRLWWVLHFGQQTNDTRVYAEFASNMLRHGIYGFSNTGSGAETLVSPTLIRLPGYPLFLMACFRLFGLENYTAVMLVQVVVDLWTCLLLGGLAARIFGRRAGVAALWLGALCPFMANYVAVPLTETLTLWCIAAAFYGLLRWHENGGGLNRWAFGVAVVLAYAILLRPEQGLLAAAVLSAMWWYGRAQGWLAALRPALVVAMLTLLPLVPWTVRNWQVFHVFEPLAPRFATDPGALVNYGFQRWYRTWAIEFASTESVYWNYDGAPIDIAALPDRAFDSRAQYVQTKSLLADYNRNDNPTEALDARFNAIALARIHDHPARYYFVLPVARVLDMVFRPRTELMAVPLEWWKFHEQRWADVFALIYAGLNLGFFVLAGITLMDRKRWRGNQVLVCAMLMTMAMRAALLLTLDNAEARYTLEFFPVLIVLASARFAEQRRS